MRLCTRGVPAPEYIYGQGSTLPLTDLGSEISTVLTLVISFIGVNKGGSYTRSMASWGPGFGPLSQPIAQGP
jgi:hypothetical protein